MEANRGLKPGDKFNDELEVVRELGRGFTGIVYEVHNPFTRSSYAVKLMHDANEHQLSRLSAEATMLVQLEHKHVVRVHNAGQRADGRGWLQMELLKGHTLGDLLAKQGRFSPLLAIRYILGIAWGVDAAHEMGVIHRDLKPDNVFIIDGENLAKVLDFSGAKYLTADLRTTKPPDMTGTAAYMSPEQIDGHTADGRIDVYALGLIFWEMLAGVHPFQVYFKNLHRLLIAQASEMPARLTARLGLPGYFDEVIRRAMAKDPDRRYQTVAAFAQAVLEAKARYLADVEAGVVVLEKRLGEPSLHDTDSRQEYQPPKALTRPDTAPITPAERITIAHRAAPESPPRDDGAPGGERASLGPMGTVRLSEIFAVADHAKQAISIAASGAAPTASPSPASQIPTERIQRTAAMVPPASPIPADRLSNTVTPGPVVSDLGAGASIRARVAPARAAHGLRRVLVAALVASVTGSLGIVWLMRPPGPAPAPEPAAITTASDPLPTAPTSAPPADIVDPAPPAPPPPRSVPAPPTAAPAPEHPAPPAPPVSVRAPRSLEPPPTTRVPAHPAPLPVAATAPQPPVAVPAPAPEPAKHRLFGTEN